MLTYKVWMYWFSWGIFKMADTKKAEKANNWNFRIPLWPLIVATKIVCVTLPAILKQHILLMMTWMTWWKHFPRYWPFVRAIHRSPVNSPHKDQWHGALLFSLICGWINGWVNNWDAGDLRRHCAHHDVTVIYKQVKTNISEDLCMFFITN